MHCRRRDMVHKKFPRKKVKTGPYFDCSIEHGEVVKGYVEDSGILGLTDIM